MTPATPPPRAQPPTADFRCGIVTIVTPCAAWEDLPLTADGSRLTRRLRLEPAGPAGAADLWLVHNDDNVWPWYGNQKPSLEQARQRAKFMGESWRDTARSRLTLGQLMG